MILLPPPADCCPICAVKHKPEMPHNQQSMYYQYRFYIMHGRWPTWADALAHCSDDMKSYWHGELGEHYNEPAPGIAAIAEHPADASHEPVGDVNDPVPPTICEMEGDAS